MSTDPSLPVVQRKAVNWHGVLEVVLLVLLAGVIAVAVIWVLLLIAASQIEVG